MKVTGSTIEQLDKGVPKGKCRRWRLWLTVPEAGKRPSRRYEGTWTGAQGALEAFRAEWEGKSPTAGTFGAYMASWLRWRESSGDYAPGTIANNRREVSTIARSELAGMEITEITPADCRDALAWVKAHGRNVDVLSNTTMNKLYITLAAIMQQAVDDGVIARSPMARIKAPRPDTAEKDALEPAALMEVVGALSTLPFDGRTMALYFICLLGLRRGEACGLYDADVDGLCHVRRAVKERDGSIAEPKSAAGVRTLPMPALLAEKADEWRWLRGQLGFDGPTLCCNTVGGVLRPQLLQRWWSGDGTLAGVRDSIGCAGLTLHQLRHSNLSMMARHMSPFDLQRYAGWSSIAPAKVYIHEDLGAVTAAVEGAWCGLNAPETHQKRAGQKL